MHVRMELTLTMRAHLRMAWQERPLTMRATTRWGDLLASPYLRVTEKGSEYMATA